MKNLLPYIDDTFSLYEEAVAAKKNGLDKTLLTNSKDLIQHYYNEYDSHFDVNMLSTIDVRRTSGQLYKALYDLYRYNSKIVRKIRSALIELNPKTVSGICQHCGINSLDTMDHILPRTNYAEYSINAKNLIPCCTDCNRRKNALNILNLYTDILPKTEYLFMDVLANGDTIDFIFRLDNFQGQVDTVLFQKIKKHYTQLELLERMKIKALSELKGFVLSIRLLYENLGKDIVIKFTIDNLSELRDAYGFNHWRVAFYKGLVTSSVFWEYYEFGLLE